MSLLMFWRATQTGNLLYSKISQDTNDMKNSLKIGIITFSYSHNVGSSLQTFALQQKILDLCKESFPNCKHQYVVDVINYEKKDWLGSYDKSIVSFLRHPRKYFLHWIILWRIRRYNRFQKKHIIFNSLKRCHNSHDLTILNNNYNIFITGSDQVWNFTISKVDFSYFLEFVNETNRKIAYAPSVGIDSIPYNLKDRVSILVNRFDYLSSREVSGKELIYSLTGRDSEVVLDPTLLYDRTYWTSKFNLRSNNEKYILIYIRDNHPTKIDQYAQQLSFEKGLKIIRVYGTRLNNNYIHIVGPEEWLQLVYGAEYVFTNSFHAVAFSINFHKKFFVDINQNSWRINHILSIVHLESRVIDTNIQDVDIDYSYVDETLAEFRIRSIQYIKNAIFSE